MSEESDNAALIRRAQNGDRGAFEDLVRGHYDMMYRMAFKWCGDKADAEDLLVARICEGRDRSSVLGDPHQGSVDVGRKDDRSGVAPGAAAPGEGVG